MLVGAPAKISANRANAIAGKGRRVNAYCFFNQRLQIIDCPTLTATVSQVTLTDENARQLPQASLQSLAFEGNQAVPFWLVVPTYNPGLQDWAQWLQALQSQECQPARLVVVDSGSTDGSLALTQAAFQKAIATKSNSEQHQAPALTLLHVKANQFDHGGTRQWALNQALEDPSQDHPQVVVFMTQDAILAHPEALGSLVQSFRIPKVAAAYGRQLPKTHAGWLETHARNFNYPAQSRTVQLQDKESLGFKSCFFSNAFGAYSLAALIDQGGLPAKLPLGEDTYIAAKLLLSGQSLHYQANAAVYHSHQYNRQQDFQRMFDTGVFHALNPWLLQSFGRAEGEGCRLVMSQWKFLKSHQPSKLGLGAVQILAVNGLKFLGYKLGLWHRLLPRVLKVRMSMYKTYWLTKP